VQHYTWTEAIGLSSSAVNIFLDVLGELAASVDPATGVE
jgi:hypothetical protein